MSVGGTPRPSCRTLLARSVMSLRRPSTPSSSPGRVNWTASVFASTAGARGQEQRGWRGGGCCL
eukprot:5731992-Alexandrium_andersonii.AAC.1